MAQWVKMLQKGNSLVQTPLGAWSEFWTQPCNYVSGGLQFEIVTTQ